MLGQLKCCIDVKSLPSSKMEPTWVHDPKFQNSQQSDLSLTSILEKIKTAIEDGSKTDVFSFNCLMRKVLTSQGTWGVQQLCRWNGTRRCVLRLSRVLGTWCVLRMSRVRGSWCVVRMSWCVLRTSRVSSSCCLLRRIRAKELVCTQAEQSLILEREMRRSSWCVLRTSKVRVTGLGLLIQSFQPVRTQ